MIVTALIGRWQEEQEAEQRRKDAMKLGDEERETILQVIIMNYKNYNDHDGIVNPSGNDNERCK